MKEIIIDSSIINHNHCSGPYNVRYMLYYDSKPRGKDSIYISKEPAKEHGMPFNSNTACFAGVSREMSSYTQPTPYDNKPRQNIPIPNRLHFKLGPASGTPKLSATERYAWLRLCKEYKLLPNYVAPSTVTKKNVVFDISEISPALLYVYLSMMRAIVEYPGFVKAIVYLVNKLKMNYYAAFVYASKMYITNTGHHIMTPNRDYKQKAHSMSNIEAHLMINLRRFIDDPSEFDSRHITEINKGGWCCASNIMNVSNLRAGLKLEDLFKPSLEKAIMTDDDKKAQHYLDQIKKDPAIKVTFKNSALTKPKKTVRTK